MNGHASILLAVASKGREKKRRRASAAAPRVRTTKKKTHRKVRGEVEGIVELLSEMGVAGKRDKRGNRSTLGHIKLSKNVCVTLCVRECVRV